MPTIPPSTTPARGVHPAERYYRRRTATVVRPPASTPLTPDATWTFFAILLAQLAGSSPPVVITIPHGVNPNRRHRRRAHPAAPTVVLPRGVPLPHRRFRAPRIVFVPPPPPPPVPPPARGVSPVDRRFRAPRIVAPIVPPGDAIVTPDAIWPLLTILLEQLRDSAPPIVPVIPPRGVSPRQRFHRGRRPVYHAIPPDFLAALVAFLRGCFPITQALTPALGKPGYGALGTSQIFTEMADPVAFPPFLIIQGFAEMLPGESLDDHQIKGRLTVFANDLDQCAAIAETVRNNIDSPNISPEAAGRDPLAYVDGNEVFVMRDNTSTTKNIGIGKGGLYVWTNAIDYVFVVEPES